MPLPDSVAELVARYADNRSEYRKGDYNETLGRSGRGNAEAAWLNGRLWRREI